MVIYLDTYKKMNIMPYIKLRQCDKLVDMYQFCIFDDGMETDLSKFTSAEFLGTNAKGQMASFILNLPESGNVINAVFPDGMSGVVGKYQNAYIRLSTADGVTSTCEVNVLVLPAVDLNAEQAEEYHTVLDDVLVQYNETWNSFLVDRESDYADLAERMNALDARYETNEDKLNALQQMLEQIGVYSKVESDEKYATKQDLSNHEAVARQELNDHKSNVSNPHNVTKAQVGLTNVENYGIATLSEAQTGTSDEKYMTPLKTIQAIKKVLLDFAYPIGTIYQSTSSANPSTFMGGTWERYRKGKVLVSLDEEDADFATVGKTGGEKSHTLTVDEMPSHSHDTVSSFVNAAGQGTKIPVAKGDSYGFGYGSKHGTTATGGGLAHNNLPPYTTIYIWRRIA